MYVQRFETREAVLTELLSGRHRHNLEGWQCPRCARIHVRVRSPMLTPFSGQLELPEGVVVDVDADWRRSEKAAATSPTCPTDATPMRRIRR